MRRSSVRVATWLAASAVVLFFGFARGSAPPAGAPRIQPSPVFEAALHDKLLSWQEPRQLVLEPEDHVRSDGQLAVLGPSGGVSGCVGSACVISGCLGSVCLTSYCGGSVCYPSICGGSVCAGSLCAGSACGASGCFGSVCTGSGCVGSVCAGQCL